ncbi:hypothetical protein RB531_5180 [Salmonella enterica subsp. enterica serovar Typhimurium]
MHKRKPLNLLPLLLACLPLLASCVPKQKTCHPPGRRKAHRKSCRCRQKQNNQRRRQNACQHARRYVQKQLNIMLESLTSATGQE